MNIDKIQCKVLALSLPIISSFLIQNSKAQNVTQPNILLIIGDDIGVDVLNGYGIGTNLPTTPNLDKLRSQGITFTNAWSSPVCSATRASLLSGKYGFNNGVNSVPEKLDTTNISIFKAIKAKTNNAYTCCVTGKWHVGPTNNLNHPYEHGADNFMGYMGASLEDYSNWTKVENGLSSNSQNYSTSVFTNYAQNWIKQQNQPWFMWLAHAAPHTPIHIPPTEMYSISGTSARPRQYLAMIESLDYEIGRLLDSIPQNVLENTLIIFLGDNGTPENFLQNYPSGHGKSTVYEGGIRVPLIIAGKGLSKKKFYRKCINKRK